MKAIIQRVKEASVSVDEQTIGIIGTGLVILLGIGLNDDEVICDWIVNKIVNLRIFPDENDVMNVSLKDCKGEILLISNFTVYGVTKKGFRPSWSKAAPPQEAENIYNKMLEKLKATGIKVEAGQFQAEMDVSLINWGPVTLTVEKENE